MGTRNLVCVMKDREYRVAQYGQWDGYPDGQGIDVLKFLKTYNKEKFLNNLDKYIQFGTDEQIQEQWIQCGSDGSGWCTSDISDKHDQLFPENSRNTGAGILSIIAKTKKKLLLQNTIDFAVDSLFCEFVYVVDFDKNTYEIYEGFNENFLDPNERFSFLINNKTEEEHILDKLTGNEIKYFPVKLIKTFDLDNLPSKKDFLNSFKVE